MDHEVIWVAPFPDKMLGLNRSGMRQLCFMVDEDNSTFIINDNLRARFLENSFEIYINNEQCPSFRFYFDEETFTNDKAYKHIIDDFWLQVKKYQNDPYVGGISYSFIVYKEVKEVPENIKNLSQEKRKLYDTIRSSYQHLFLNTKIIGVTEDQIPDDLYITDTEYKDDKDLARVYYHLMGDDYKGYPVECNEIKRQIQVENKGKIDIVEKGQSVKEWLSIPKNRKGLSALNICHGISFKPGVKDYNKHHRDVLIILLND